MLNEKQMKYVKILWLPVVIIILFFLEPYLGLTKPEYAIVYFILNMGLFALYIYILAKSGLIFKSFGKTTNTNMKGKRKKKSK